MEQEPKKVKVPVTDKRGAARAARGKEVAETTPGVEVWPDGNQVLMDESSGVEQTPVPAPKGGREADDNGPGDSGHDIGEASTPAGVDYLDALQRERATFANFRKRAAQERLEAETRGMAKLIEDLLPVLDTFDAAIAHGEGVELMYKQFKNILESKGLEELPGAGSEFDPEIHHAIRVVEEDGGDGEVVKEVHQRGYRFGDQVLRAATVTVVRPSGEAGE